MSQGVFFGAVGPIGETDTDALPVKEIGPAVGYYTQCLGFSLVSKDRTTAKLKRDDVRIGLAVNGRDPEQASCWFSVGDVDALRRSWTPRASSRGSSTSRNMTASRTSSSSQRNLTASASASLSPREPCLVRHRRPQCGTSICNSAAASASSSATNTRRPPR